MPSSHQVCWIVHLTCTLLNMEEAIGLAFNHACGVSVNVGGMVMGSLFHAENY